MTDNGKTITSFFLFDYMSVRRHSVFLFVLFLLILPNTGKAQDTLAFDFGADLVSRYVRNGTDIGGHAPAVQPWASVGIKNFTVGLWGSFALSDVNANEMDWYIEYKIGKFVSVRLMDIFWPNDTLVDNNYFNYNTDEFNSPHNFRGSIDIQHPNIPLAFHAQTFLYSRADIGESGAKRYSSYIEINYKAKFKGIELMPFAGITPDTGFWGDKPSFVNVGCQFRKAIKFSESIQIPFFAKVIVNPNSENIFFITGIQL